MNPSGPPLELVDCWDCAATGISCLAHANTSFRDITCSRCKGTGKCPAVMREWMILGAAMREDRQRNDYSLREWAIKRGWRVSQASDAERGRIDPRSLT